MNTVKSNINGRYYNPAKMIRIVDNIQAGLYIAHGATLYDAYKGKGIGNTDLRVYVFLRDETLPLYELWRKGELTTSLLSKIERRG